MPEKTVRTMRHDLAVRLVHWAIVFEGAFLLLSGLQLNGILSLGLAPNLYSYHIIVGFAFIGTSVIFFYVVLAEHDYHWFGLRRIPYSIRFILSEAGYWFRIRPKVDEDRIKFDATKGQYVEKLIPSVIVVWWLYIAMGVILTLTGLADAFPKTFAWEYTLLNPIGLALTGVDGLPWILAVHRLMAVLLVCTVTLHLYASILYKLVGSIFIGYRNEPVADLGPPKAPPIRTSLDAKMQMAQPSHTLATDDEASHA
jgi:methanophenazine hydrogenase, cytochrome b subunit